MEGYISCILKGENWTAGGLGGLGSVLGGMGMAQVWPAHAQHGLYAYDHHPPAPPVGYGTLDLLHIWCVCLTESLLAQITHGWGCTVVKRLCAECSSFSDLPWFAHRQNADEIDSMFGFGVDDVAGLLESDVRASERPPPTLPTPLSSVPGAARLPIPPNPLSVHANSFFVASTVIGHLWHMHKQLSAVPMGACPGKYS